MLLTTRLGVFFYTSLEFIVSVPHTFSHVLFFLCVCFHYLFSTKSHWNVGKYTGALNLPWLPQFRINISCRKRVVSIRKQQISRKTTTKNVIRKVS